MRLSLQVAFPSPKELGETYDALVVGAGPAELAAAIYLTRANLKSLVLEADKHGGKLNAIRLIENYLGETTVEKIKIKSADGKIKELDVQGVFVSREKTPVGAILANNGLKTDSSGCIKVDKEMHTSLSGVYAASDITCGRKFQIAVSVGQGVTAALSIIRSHVEARGKRRT